MESESTSNQVGESRGLAAIAKSEPNARRSHNPADTDLGRDSIHHTLGLQTNQAAPGIIVAGLVWSEWLELTPAGWDVNDPYGHFAIRKNAYQMELSGMIKKITAGYTANGVILTLGPDYLPKTFKNFGAYGFSGAALLAPAAITTTGDLSIGVNIAVGGVVSFDNVILPLGR